MEHFLPADRTSLRASTSRRRHGVRKICNLTVSSKVGTQNQPHKRHNYRMYHQPGVEILADYSIKAHIGPIYTRVHPYYLQMKNSPACLLRIAQPAARQGCTEILGDPYTKGILLPRISYIRAPGRDSQFVPVA